MVIYWNCVAQKKYPIIYCNMWCCQSIKNRLAPVKASMFPSVAIKTLALAGLDFEEVLEITMPRIQKNALLFDL